MLPGDYQSVMQPPVVSVIVTCYNLGQYLDEAVDSVLAQTFQDLEILVIDDGSDDPDTVALLEGYTRTKTRLLRTTNRGLPAARNLGIRHATGQHICALDADDRLEPTWLERAVTLLEVHPEFAFVSHWLEAFGDEQWDWKPVRCDLAMLLDINVINGAALVRRRVFEEVGGFDESMRDGCEDWEFWIRVMERGYRGVIVPEVLYRYRRRHDSMSREMNRTDLYLRLYSELVEKHAESYSRYLLDLVLRREWTISDLCRKVRAVEGDLRGSVEPALEERRREVGRAKQRLIGIEAREADLAERRALAERAARLERECEEEKRRTDWLDRQAAGQRERLHVLEGELARERDASARRVRQFQESWSWRLTAPLRWIYERLGLAGRP